MIDPTVTARLAQEPTVWSPDSPIGAPAPALVEESAPPSSEWVNLSTRDHFTAPIQYGVDCKVENRVKYYRAWAVIGPLDERLESPVYEACDSADPNFASNLIAAQSQLWRQNETVRAAIVRSQMRDDQASLTDMDEHARLLGMQAVKRYEEWQREEQVRLAALVEDEAALKSARTLIRGLQLLLENGTDEEISTIKAIWPGKR